MDEIKTVKKTSKTEEIYIERGYANDDPNLFVSVGGKNYLLPKGKNSTVPTHVAEEIRRSRAAQERFENTCERLASKNQ